jgi:peptidyl-prolyl cis-trans isomerase B (cyclophilin B)
MKCIKILAALLSLALLCLSFAACSQTTGTCDMAQVKAEINSMSAEDFTETTDVSEYVKLTIKGYGDVIIRLRADIAPITVENFQKLVSEGFYDGLTFHRIISYFMIQGGDPDGDGRGGSDQTIKGEYAKNGVTNQLSHVTGVVSMARLGDPYYDSASSQFFICTSSDYTSSLDGGYAGFGYVVAGLDVVLKVAKVQTGAADRPVEPVVMEKICFVQSK